MQEQRLSCSVLLRLACSMQCWCVYMSRESVGGCYGIECKAWMF
jgi:hypothetical protein